MAFLFGSKSPFEELVEKATSELLPEGSEIMSLNFEVCDQIRSKQVPAKDAMRTLKKRITYKNSTVQTLALKLTDVCIKNGGQHFLLEVSTPEFVGGIVEQLRNETLPQKLRLLILQYIQSWALAFRGKPQLEYVCTTYNNLKTEGGWHFPPEDKANVSSIMLDTNAPPEWTDSAVCERCRTTFTFANRKHHCRACGRTFCGQCSSKNIALPHLGVQEEVRVCDSCFACGGKQVASASPNKVLPIKKNENATPVPSSNFKSRKEQEDLDHAIALSLAESEKQHVSTASSRRAQSPPATTGSKDSRSSTMGLRDPLENEDDQDLLSAITASLADAKLRNSPFNAGMKGENRSAAPKNNYDDGDDQPLRQAPNRALDSAPAAQAQPAVRPSIGLSAIELENIELFTQMMQKLEEQGDVGAILASREYAALHQTMSGLQPRMTAWLHETLATHRQLVDLHQQVTEALRKYESAIENRLGGIIHPFYGPQITSKQLQAYAGPPPSMSRSAQSAHYGQPHDGSQPMPQYQRTHDYHNLPPHTPVGQHHQPTYGPPSSNATPSRDYNPPQMVSNHHEGGPGDHGSQGGSMTHEPQAQYPQMVRSQSSQEQQHIVQQASYPQQQAFYSGQPQNTNYNNQPQQPQYTGYANQPSQSQQPGYANQPSQSQQPGYANQPPQSQQPGYPNQPQQPQYTGYHNQPPQSQQPGYPNQPPQSQQPQYSGYASPPPQPQQTGHANQPQHSQQSQQPQQLQQSQQPQYSEYASQPQQPQQTGYANQPQQQPQYTRYSNQSQQPQFSGYANQPQQTQYAGYPNQPPQSQSQPQQQNAPPAQPQVSDTPLIEL